MDAKPIIEAMLEQYARCTSYEDIGTFEQVLHFRTRAEKSSGAFSTTFIRPNLLRFDLNHNKTELSQRTVVQSDGESFRAMRTFIPDDRFPSDVTAYESVDATLRAVAGDTLGLTSLIFSLLGLVMPVAPMVNADTFSRQDDETVSATRCYKMDGVINPAFGSEATAWISVDTNSLRRYEIRCIVTEELKRLQEQMHKLTEAEGFEPDTEEFQRATFNFCFDEVTFNNSISIDKVVSPTL